MAKKRVESELVIKAVDKYSEHIKGMGKVTGAFAEKVRAEMGSLQKQRGPLNMIKDFKKQQDVVKQSGLALEKMNERVRQLMHRNKTATNVTAGMRKELDRARTAAKRLADRHHRNRESLHGLQKQLSAASVNVRDLAGEERRLTSALKQSNAAFESRAQKMARVAEMQRKISAGRERMDKSLARAANLSFVGGASVQTGRNILRGVSSPVNDAKSIETAMADVKKVVDFESPEAFAQMKADILSLTTDENIPMAAEGIAAIVAAGGQANIPRDELLEYAEMAAKVGVAFDVSAEQAGTGMAEIKTMMGFSLKETGSLFDAMNHLSNKSAAKASDTLEFFNRVGADGKGFGFDPTETLAFGAAMIAAGGRADTAATSFRNMGKALTRGKSATDRQRSAMRKLGLDSKDVAKSMQKDAVGTTMDVLRRMKGLKDHERASVMSDLFGDEARELTKLMNNIDLAPQLLELVSKPESYAGSSDAEFRARSATTENNEDLTRNEWRRLKSVAGDTVLPVYNDILDKTREIIASTTKWTEKHPVLTKWLLLGTAALGAMAVAGGVLLTAAAGLIGTLAVLRFGLVGFGARAVFAGGGISQLIGQFAGLGRMKKFRLASRITPLRWTSKLIPAIGWSGMSSRLGRFGMNNSGWGRLITPLKWFGRGALRLIPVIGWAAMAAEIGLFAWKYLGLKELPWRDYLNKVIEWKEWFFSFAWTDFLPEWDWSDIIPSLNLSQMFGASGESSAPKSHPLMQRRATGGPFGKNPLLVGERGPELYFPNRSGFIATHSQLQKMRSLAQGIGVASAVAVGSGVPAAASSGVGGITVTGGIHIGIPATVTDPRAAAEYVIDGFNDLIADLRDSEFSD